MANDIKKYTKSQLLLSAAINSVTAVVYFDKGSHHILTIQEKNGTIDPRNMFNIC